MLSVDTEPSDQKGSNHPLAPRMAVIAFLSVNIGMACMFSTYSVVIKPLEVKLGVTRELSSLGIPLVMLATALLSPVLGFLMNRISLRLLMLLGGLISVVGYGLLAFSGSIVTFLVIYALLIGPGLTILMNMAPPTLVTRWYRVNRGRALGLVSMPIVAALASPVMAIVVRRYGISGTYLATAALMAALLVPLFFIVDFPPASADSENENEDVSSGLAPEMSAGALLSSGRFWMVVLAFASVMCGQTILAAHIVPMAIGWGIGATSAASLMSASSIGGMVGSFMFGWLADRVGGPAALAIMCFDSAILWVIMLLQPPFMVLFPVAALMGFHGAAVIAVVSMSFSQQFGRANFSRALGLSTFFNLPFLVVSVPLAAHVYVSTGSYRDAILGVIVFFVFGGICALLAGGAFRLLPPPNMQAEAKAPI